jgi:hypothetical protein
MKRVLLALTAFALGALAVYGVMSLRRQEEWGVVVVHFGGSSGLWGLFESKKECLDARTLFIEEYGKLTSAKTGRRAVAVEGPQGSTALVTFSCLPLSEIRGLPLATNEGAHGETR